MNINDTNSPVLDEEQFSNKITEETHDSDSNEGTEVKKTSAKRPRKNAVKVEIETSKANKIKIEEFHPLNDETLVPEELRELDDPDEFLPEDHHAIKNELDLSSLSKDELVSFFQKILNEKPVEAIKNEVESVKINYYKKHKTEIEKQKKEFVDAGGKFEEFELPEDTSEINLKELIRKYKELKAELSQKIEKEREENLKIKQRIIEEIKDLVNGNDSLNETYNKFKDLQAKWKSVGPVPPQYVNDLYENYNHNVEKFYDLIKISKELRDLDLKKNLELKIKLSEKAEELLMEPSIIKAFRLLQDYHNQWREIGPVPHDKRTETWERFKLATSKINKAHQEYFEKEKETQIKNLDVKTGLCEKAEEILNSEILNIKDWEEKSQAIIDLQTLWRTIGFAPKKDNNRIYERFHSACDEFFKKKREFFGKIKEEQNNNLKLKLDLCMQAEALKDSNDWRKTTDELIQLQRKWKETGPVPRKHSDQVWKRFRAACDTFFNNKTAFYSTIDVTYEDNLKLKINLVEEIENFILAEDMEQNFTTLKEFQRKWSEIGFVPLQKKEEISNRYRKAVDQLFDKLKLDDSKRRLIKFKSKVDSISSAPKSENILRRDREKFITHLKKLESDIQLWENNIGFFAKSKNAEAMIKDVQSKIDEAKEEIKVLEEKIRLIDNMSKD